jgi:serine-type D-Ala-D-Ala carboxypeptidase/endopeptidase
MKSTSSRPARAAIGLTMLATALGSPATAAAQRFDLDKTRTVLTRIIETAIKDQGVPSISIALVRGDSIVWKAAFGYANARTKTPATTETLYSTGSTFKSATATAIMQLVEQGKLSLDDPVNRYLGDSPIKDQKDKPVTFTHILSHWSGLTAGATTKPIWGRELPKTLEQMVSELRSVRAPEVQWEYNNFAYGLAGLLVHKISGIEYEKYMVENVLKPLGITTPHPVYPSPEMVELMALPYEPTGGGKPPKPVAQVHFDVYPAGDVYLTAEDMARFLGAHLNGGVFNGKRILSEASVKKMHEPQFGGTYGLGFSVSKDSSNGHIILSHGGGIPGQSSNMMADVDAKVGVYYMSNSGAPVELGVAALALLRGEDYVPRADRKSVVVDPKILDSYAGVYEMGPGPGITIARDGKGLILRGFGPNDSHLIAETSTRFFVPGAGFMLTFVKGDDGVVSHFVLEVGQSRHTAKRRK